ncbi:MAG: SH3 domain-containing protein [Clostridia bacterium]|nr:SH3 domain-containing protein [Clostridia bacterium]
MSTIQENIDKQIYNQISPILKAYNEPIIQAGKAVAEASKYYNNYLNANREQLSAISKSISSVAETYKRMYNEPLMNLTRKLSEVFNEYNKINNTKIASLVENMNNVIKISSLKDMYTNIDFNKILINNSGTIEYDGVVFEKNEIEESSTELIKDIAERKSIKADTLLKRILLSFIIIFSTFFMSGNDIEWILLAIMAGFFGQVGANMFEFFKEKFFKNYDSDDNNKNKYFKEHSAIVKLEELKVRKKPNSNEKIIGCLYFSQLVKIEDVKPYWTKIEYKDKESKISISGWVSTKGLKRFNTLTSQFEDIEENELGV